MVSLTFIELHFDGDTQLGPTGLGETTADGREPDVDEELGEGDDPEEDGGKPIGVLIGLVLLVALGLAVRKVRGGDDPEDRNEFEDFEEVDEPDVVVD